jgi:hypothetical protein
VAQASGKDEVARHYIRFYQQYFETNTDEHAESYLARQLVMTEARRPGDQPLTGLPKRSPDHSHHLVQGLFHQHSGRLLRGSGVLDDECDLGRGELLAERGHAVTTIGDDFDLVGMVAMLVLAMLVRLSGLFRTPARASHA